MIKVTISGPIGSGKSRIGMAIRDYAERTGQLAVWERDCTPAALREAKPDILLVEEQTHDQ